MISYDFITTLKYEDFYEKGEFLPLLGKLFYTEMIYSGLQGVAFQKRYAFRRPQKWAFALSTEHRSSPMQMTGTYTPKSNIQSQSP